MVMLSGLGRGARWHQGLVLIDQELEEVHRHGD
jgi:hypothetical protein